MQAALLGTYSNAEPHQEALRDNFMAPTTYLFNAPPPPPPPLLSEPEFTEFTGFTEFYIHPPMEIPK